MNEVTKQDVIACLREFYARAVQSHSGVSYILDEKEQALIDEADIEQIKNETGYTAMCEGYSALRLSDAEFKAVCVNNNVQ